MSKIAGYLIQEILSTAHVDKIWGISGDSANFITEAVCTNDIRFMHVRHEESAGFAAGAESLINKRITACIGSCGPGTLHLAYGLYDANKSGASVLCIATQIPKDQIGTRYVQETDTMKLFRDCSVFCEYVQSPEQIPRLMGIAMQKAITKKGVAVIIVPGDVSSAKLSDSFNLKYKPHYAHPVVLPSADDLKAAADLLNNSVKTAIIADVDCPVTASQIKQLAAKLNAPLGWNLRSKELLAFDNQYPLGCVNRFYPTWQKEAIQQADVLFTINMHHAPEAIWDTKAKIIQLEKDGVNLGGRHRVDMPLMGTYHDTLKALLPLIQDKTDKQFGQDTAAAYEKLIQKQTAAATNISDEKGVIKCEYLIKLLNNKAAQNAIFTTDAGMAATLTAAYIEPTAERQFIQSAVYASEGSALPLAFGVASATENRQLIAVCTGKGLSMLLGDLLTVLQMNLDIKILVLNTSGTMATDATDADDTADCSLAKTDFAGIATHLGLVAQHVALFDELDSAMNEWLNTKGAALLDVDVTLYDEKALF